MKTLLLVLVLGWTSLSMGAFPKASIQELSGAYQNSAGKARAKAFQFNEHDFGENVEFDVEKQGTSLYLSTEEQEFEFKDLPLAVDKIEGVKWNGLNLESSEAKIDLALKSFIGQYTDQVLNLHGLRVICDHAGGSGVGEYLNACLNNKGHLSFSKVETTSNGKKTTIGDFSLSTHNGRLRFQIKASAKVKGKGEISYKDNVVTIKITEAKSSGFSVRSRFFKELRKLQSENIKVKRPYITISL